MRTLKQAYDLFFIRQDFYDKHLQDFRGDLILPKLDFFQHPDYSSIHAISSYKTWRITFDYVLVAPAKWYENLPSNLQYDLLNEQRRNHNGMMFKDNLVTIDFWNRMAETWQHEMITKFDDPLSKVDLMDHIPEKIIQYHNRIPDNHGPNCYAAVIYCITDNREIINEWMFSDTFIKLLERNDYRVVEDIQMKTGDVICFYDSQQILQHACYMVSDTLCFNKHGQTFNDFWAIDSVAKIITEWPNMTLKIYRKTN